MKRDFLSLEILDLNLDLSFYIDVFFVGILDLDLGLDYI